MGGSYCLLVLEVRSLRPPCGRGWFSLGRDVGSQLHPLSLLLVVPAGSGVSLLWTRRPALSSSPPCVQISFLEGHGSCWMGAHANELILT